MTYLGLGEVEELAGLDLDGALDSGVGGEGPAGAALALVLDLIDGASLAPVDGGAVGVAVELGNVLGAGKVALDGLEAELGRELVEGEVGELVDGHLVGGVAIVVGDDGLIQESKLAGREKKAAREGKQRTK